MKRIVAIFLVSLLGFLGCSDSNDGTSTFTGEATPVAPYGITDSTTPTYAWTPVPGATRYLHLVEDIAEVPVIEEWYSAEEGECASEDGLCSVTPKIIVFGNTWKVMACAGEKCALWSDELQFSFAVQGPPQERFTDNGDSTVTDNKHKNMWTKDVNQCGERTTWLEAMSRCEDLNLAGHSDWHLPTIYELFTLQNRTATYPTMPYGHPFIYTWMYLCWSSTPLPNYDRNAWSFSFEGCYVVEEPKILAGAVPWCVRGVN